MRKIPFFCAIALAILPTGITQALEIGLSATPGLGFWFDGNADAIAADANAAGADAILVPAPMAGVSVFADFPLTGRIALGAELGARERVGAWAVTAPDGLSFATLSLASVDLLGTFRYGIPLGNGAIGLSAGLGLGFVASPLASNNYWKGSSSSRKYGLEFLSRLLPLVRLGAGWEFPVRGFVVKTGLVLEGAFATFDPADTTAISVLPAASAELGVRMPLAEIFRKRNAP